MLWGPVQLAMAWVGLQQSTLHDNQPLGPWSSLDVISPPLDFALPPLEGVWHGMNLVEFVFCFVALSPLLLMLLPALSS
jgi:hypothetical protein